ncbi:MAG: ABC transporter permease [Betaproteobacteria bacterium]
MPDGRGDGLPDKALTEQYLADSPLSLGLALESSRQAADVSEGHRRYLDRLRRRQRLVSLARLVILVLFLTWWEVAARAQWINPFIFSYPTQVIEVVVRMGADGSLWRHIAWTISETAIGFTAGTFLGTLIAIALWWSGTFARILDPYLVVLNSIPKVALGPIFIVWLGTRMPAIVAMALAISVIVTVMMVFTGFQEVDPDKIKLLRTFGATRGQILWKVVLPASVPTIVAALKVSVGQSLVGVIMGEFLVSQAGLGYLIVYGGQMWKMSLIMASLAVLCLMSMGLYYGVSWLERRFLGWRG